LAIFVGLLVAMTVSATAGAAAAVSRPITTAAVGGSWSLIADFPSGAAPMSLTAGVDGRLYMFGFCQDSSCAQRNGPVGYGAPVTYVYVPDKGLWRNGVGAPTDCSDAQASAVDAEGLIHLAGCWHDIMSDAGFHEAVLDPATWTWTMQGGHGPYVDPIAGMTSANGDLYWFSQALQKQGTAVFISGYRVVIESGLWFKGTAVPNFAPSEAAVLGQDGQVYALGGARTCQPEFGPCAVPAVQAWRAVSNSWHRVTRLPTARIRLAAATDAQGRIFTMAGLAPDGSKLFRTVQVYVPSEHRWLKAPRLNEPRFAALATATADGRVWILGGYDAFGSPMVDGEVWAP
jgi:N-acetylneuraminic acid mutarotase